MPYIILHLFKTATTPQSFPTLWIEVLIILTFKKDDRFSTDNCREIIISSCVGKLYIKIVTKRISDYIVAPGQWSQKHCGFEKDRRTKDMLYVLNSIYESYVVNKNQDAWIAFVNFSILLYDKQKTFILQTAEVLDY